MTGFFGHVVGYHTELSLYSKCWKNNKLILACKKSHLLDFSKFLLVDKV